MLLFKFLACFLILDLPFAFRFSSLCRISYSSVIMPFQTAIESTAWPLYCISYNELKRSVYDILKSDSVCAFPEREFQELLQSELDKINLFAVIKYEDIFRSLQSIAVDPQESSEISIDAVSREIVNLDRYVRVNCEGFIRIVSKFDRIVKSHGANWFIARLGKEEFCSINFQSLFILLSLTWSKFRSAKDSASTTDTWRPPESFVRSTAKYWVKPENVARLKASVLKHLPYLIFGSSIKDQERFLDPTSLLAAASEGLSETQLVTSIYFDNTRRDIYRDRILRKEGARLVRFRWYGPNEGSPDQEVFIERKIHHESWVDESSSKDRFCVKQKQVRSLMDGTFDIETNVKPDLKKLAHEVDTMIREYRLQPFIRTCYHRCAFQLATSNDVRVSLDTQMSLINEFVEKNGTNWCRLASDVLAEEDVVRFPFAILEIKLGDARNSPAWLHQMLEQCGAVRVHKFSKFIHAMAFLHLDRSMMLPHWFDDFKTEPVEEVHSQNIGDIRIGEILISQSTEDGVNETSEKTKNSKVKDMRAIEPKSVFANERTWLHYCQKGMYLLGVSIVMARQDHALISGILTVICLAYFATVYSQFTTRQQNLLARMSVGKSPEERLNISSGPLLAATMILIGSIVSFTAKNFS